MANRVLRGFTDTAKSGREGALRGAPATGSPAEGITRENSFDWLNQITDTAENLGNVVNAVKGAADPKPASSVQKPATAFGGLNPTIIIGAVVALIAVVFLLRK
jgi:hypothetical protein